MQTLSHADLVNYIFMTIAAAVTCLKHEGFREEREWRIIYQPGRNFSPLMEEEVKSINGVPQTIYKLPFDKSVSSELNGIDFVAMFDKLIIGPSPQPWVMYEAFVRELKNTGVANAEGRVMTSGIPLRSL